MKLDEIVKAIEKLPPEVQERVYEDLSDLSRAKKREEAQVNFMKYVKAMWHGIFDLSDNWSDSLFRENFSINFGLS